MAVWFRDVQNRSKWDKLLLFSPYSTKIYPQLMKLHQKWSILSNRNSTHTQNVGKWPNLSPNLSRLHIKSTGSLEHQITSICLVQLTMKVNWPCWRCQNVHRPPKRPLSTAKSSSMCLHSQVRSWSTAAQCIMGRLFLWRMNKFLCDEAFNETRRKLAKSIIIMVC